MLKPTREEMIVEVIDKYHDFMNGKSIIKSIPKRTNSTINIRTEEKKPLYLWKIKDFIKYFAFKYQEKFEINYNIRFESDIALFTKTINFFKSMGLDSQAHLKRFIDWCFENDTLIIDRYQYITPMTINNFINEYIQSSLDTSSHKPEIEYDFMPDLEKLYEDKKMLLALRRYGLPIVLSYLNSHKNLSEDVLINNILKIETDKDTWSKIAKASILRSPYPSEMNFLNWRIIFKDKFKNVLNESWWRTTDYTGLSNNSYKKIIKK